MVSNFANNGLISEISRHSSWPIISHINYWYQVIPGKIYRNSGIVHFAEINQAPSPYSMLQHIGRVATPKLVPRNCLRYLQKSLIKGVGWLVSEFMWGFLSSKYASTQQYCVIINQRCIAFSQVYFGVPRTIKLSLENVDNAQLSRWTKADCTRPLQMTKWRKKLPEMFYKKRCSLSRTFIFQKKLFLFLV